MSYQSAIHSKAVDLVKSAVEMTTAAGSGHPTSAASLAHLVTVLLYDQMRYDPEQPDASLADRLVLSEGHACPIVYAAAADLGFPLVVDGHRRRMTPEDIETLRRIDSPLDGHPNPAEGFPFFPSATGSLGQGLSVAAGLALAARLDGIPKRVYCLIGDGESREGQIWEAMDFLSDYDLRAVCPIFNCNQFGQTGQVSPRQSSEAIGEKCRAFGFEPHVIDGHDPLAIREAFRAHAAAADSKSRPVAIIANTVKAWGFQDVLGSEVHGKAVSESDLPKALALLEAKHAQLNAKWSDDEVARPEPIRVEVKRAPSAPPPASLTEAVETLGKQDMLTGGALAPRKAFGIALEVLGRANPMIVALDGDVGNSTYSDLFREDEAMAGRFFECRIAEQNMISCAVGLASEGKIPFAATFAKFLSRAYDQLEMALVSGAHLKLVGSHVGASVGADGPSQMGLSDVAFFRAFTSARDKSGRPLMHVLNPSDGYGAYRLTLAMAAYEGACYLRTVRSDVPLLYDDRTLFELGGHHLLYEGEDVLLVATGYTVHEVVKAVRELWKEGVNPTVVDLYSLPFDGKAIADLAVANHGRVLTVEDNYAGGFGAAVADALAAHGSGLQSVSLFTRRIPKSGRTSDDVLDYLGLSASHIAAAALRLASKEFQSIAASNTAT